MRNTKTIVNPKLVQVEIQRQALTRKKQRHRQKHIILTITDFIINGPTRKICCVFKVHKIVPQHEKPQSGKNEV